MASKEKKNIYGIICHKEKKRESTHFFMQYLGTRFNLCFKKFNFFLLKLSVVCTF